MPGILVVIEPALIGVPVAFSPVPSAHFVSSGVVPPASLTLPPPPPPDDSLSSLPQAATPTAKTSVASTASSRSGLSRSFTSSPPRTIQYRRHRARAQASPVTRVPSQAPARLAET